MTKEELLIPRYLCESPTDSHYPYSPFKVGDILTLNQISGNGSNCCTINGVVYSEAALNKYPHLFRRLEWHEFRDEKDMPEYVKTINGQHVWWFHGFGSLGEKYAKVKVGDYRSNYPLSGLLPATAEEYEQFTHPAPLGDKQ